jgi:hypothetical protein
LVETAPCNGLSSLLGVAVAMGTEERDRVGDVGCRSEGASSDGFEHLCKYPRAFSHLFIEIKTSFVDVDDDCSLVLEDWVDSPAHDAGLRKDLPIRTLDLYDTRGADGLRTIPPGPSPLRVTCWRKFAPLSSCMHLRGIFSRRVDAR